MPRDHPTPAPDSPARRRQAAEVKMVGYITAAHGIAQRQSEKWRHCACALLSSLFVHLHFVLACIVNLVWAARCSPQTSLESMRSVSRTRSAQSGAGRSVVRPRWKSLPGTARDASFVASRNICTWRLAHALDLPRDHPRTRQTLPERLGKTFPPDLAIATAGRAPARTHARDLVSNRTVWRLSPPQPSRHAARLGVRIVLSSSVVRPSLRSAR